MDISFREDYDIDADYKIIYCHKLRGFDLYELVKTNDIYKYTYARLKPFLPAYGRSVVAKLIEKHNLNDKLIRIHTDGIILTEPYEFNEKYKPIVEEDKCGVLTWFNLNNNDRMRLKRKLKEV